MKRTNAAVVGALALVLIIAGCAGHAPVTKIDDTVASHCLESRSERAGYRDYCDVTRSCSSLDKAKADSLAKQANDFCAASPADTAANRTKIKDIVRALRAVGVAR